MNTVLTAIFYTHFLGETVVPWFSSVG